MAKLQVIARDTGDKFHPDPERSYTMPARYYISPEIYEQEKEAIFYRSWNFAGHAGQLPDVGSYFESRVHDQNVFVIRGKDHKLRAFYNVCSHRAHELVKGSGRTKVVTCPYHAWSYHIDGRLRTAGGSDKFAGFDKAEFCLKPVQVEELGGFLFINLDPDAPALARQAPGLADEMRGHEPDLDRLAFAHRLTYEVEANWKNVVDNYLECYHCTFAHPLFADLVDIKRYRSITYDVHSSHIGPQGGRESKAYIYEPGTDEQNHFAGWWIWPNFTFNTFPGAGNMATFHIIPTGPETTRQEFYFYFLDSTPSAQEMEAIEYTDKVLAREDIGLVESVQRGLRSRGYDQGRFIVNQARNEMSEHAVHHFHSLVLSALGQ